MDRLAKSRGEVLAVTADAELVKNLTEANELLEQVGVDAAVRVGVGVGGGYGVGQECAVRGRVSVGRVVSEAAPIPDC
jgi:hypothetical protein